jgi:hypothetical protein
LSSDPTEEEEKKIKIEPPSLEAEADKNLNDEASNADQFDVDNLVRGISVLVLGENILVSYLIAQ